MLSYRKPNIEDLIIYFNWANDFEVRKQSFKSREIDLITHTKWFENVIFDANYYMLIFQNKLQQNVGQVRIQKINNTEAIIGISIDNCHRRKGYAKEMLEVSTTSFFRENNNYIINAYIKNFNLASKRTFEDADFHFAGMLDYENVNSFHYIKYNL
jgi:RimJ/RimL family protein N-acetyltransferase